jgi:hypothetical protein
VASPDQSWLGSTHPCDRPRADSPRAQLRLLHPQLSTPLPHAHRLMLHEGEGGSVTLLGPNPRNCVERFHEPKLRKSVDTGSHHVGALASVSHASDIQCAKYCGAPPMNDRWRALAEPLKLGGLGLEIAPYFNALIDRGTYDIRYVDCIGNDEI